MTLRLKLQPVASIDVSHGRILNDRSFRIRLLLSYGFNDQEIAIMMSIHRATVGRCKKELRALYHREVKFLD